MTNCLAGDLSRLTDSVPHATREAGANISRSLLRNLKTSNIQLNLPQAFILNL